LIINQLRLLFTTRYICLASACFSWPELHLQNKTKGRSGLGQLVNRRSGSYVWAYYPVFSVFGPLGCCFVWAYSFLSKRFM